MVREIITKKSELLKFLKSDKKIITDVNELVEFLKELEDFQEFCKFNKITSNVNYFCMYLFFIKKDINFLKYKYDKYFCYKEKLLIRIKFFPYEVDGEPKCLKDYTLHTKEQFLEVISDNNIN